MCIERILIVNHPSTLGRMEARVRFRCRMRGTCHRFRGRCGQKARWREGNARRCLPGAPEIKCSRY